MNNDKVAWMITLCVVAFALAEPIHHLSRAIEDWTDFMRAEYTLPGTVPEKPEGHGWYLVWKNEHKELKK